MRACSFTEIIDHELAKLSLPKQLHMGMSVDHVSYLRPSASWS